MESDIVRYLEPPSGILRQGQISEQEQVVLETVNRRVAARESLDNLLGFLFEETAHIFPCDRVSIAFVEDQNRRVVSRLTRARYEPLFLKDSYSEDLRGSSLETIINTGRTRIISDLAEYAEKNPKSRSTKLLLKEGVRSSMTCPLLVEGRAVGFFFRSSKQPNSYTDREALLQAEIAERLSQAVEKLYRLDQVESANRAYLEMLGFASHELKSPLASLVMDGQLLLDGYLGELEIHQAEKIASMVKRANGLMEITRDYLDLVRLEGGELRVKLEEKVLLYRDVVQPALETLDSQRVARSIKIEVDVAEDLIVEADPGLLRVVLLNLLGNAIKYGNVEGEVRVSGDVRDGVLAVSVWNSGTGFPEKEQLALFKRFSRLNVPEFREIRGTGVGLYIAWQIIQLHCGKIWAESEYGKWAKFCFSIPQPLGI